MSTKYKAKGKRLYYLSGSTYVLIEALDNIPFNLGQYDEVEVSTHDAATDDREFIPTWKGQNSSNPTGKWDPAATSHAWLLSNHGSNTAQTFVLCYPSTPVKAISFTAKITGLNTPDDINGAIDFDFTLSSIKITSTSATDPAA